MNVFAQITKVDVAKREVWGRAAQEVPDHSSEILDYETSKPYFEAWSSDVAKSTDGKSLGNVRSMHSNVAAGKVISMTFDDAQKAIDVGVKVVDDNEWEKVLEGVHSGFSIGGKYVKKWQDGDLTRYTADPNEVSLVDRPCIPTATFFDVVKADGVIEKVAFKSQPAPAAEQAPVIAVAAIDELADMLNKGTISPARLVELAKADKPAPEKPPVDKASKGQNPHLAELTKRADDIKKGLYTVGSLADLLASLSYIQESCQWEAEYEGDNSPVPAQILVAVKQLADALVAMASEEVQEMLAALTPEQADANPDPIALAAPSGELGKMIVEAVKAAPVADWETAVEKVLTKAGSRNSAKDQEHLDAAHAHLQKAAGHLVAAGADPHPGDDKATDPPEQGADEGNNAGANKPDPEAEKTAKAGDLLKAATAPNAELMAAMAAMAEEIAKLKKQPMPMPGTTLRAVGKGEDIPAAAPAVSTVSEGTHNPNAAIELIKRNAASAGAFGRF